MRSTKKTLIIHASDPSTDFLIPIYKGMHNKTVVNGGINKSELTALIKSHDKIMMMGHGWTIGLFNTYQAKFNMGNIIITFEDVALLREKECVFIWCKAHIFVEQYGLKGFNTDMFISEVDEAGWFDIETTKEQVDESNRTFVNIFRKFRTLEPKVMHSRTRNQYKVLAEKNKVAKFNYERIFLNT